MIKNLNKVIGEYEYLLPIVLKYRWNKFPKAQEWVKLTQEEIENQNSPITSKDAECLKTLIPYHYISFFIEPDFCIQNHK